VDYTDSHSEEEEDLDTGDAECYCPPVLDADRASWRIAGNRGTFESRMTATSRQYMDSSCELGDKERRQQWTLDMGLSCCGEGPRNSWMDRDSGDVASRSVGALRVNFQVRLGIVAVASTAPHSLISGIVIVQPAHDSQLRSHSDLVFHLYDWELPGRSLEPPAGKA
jgi:hypothetical protein